MTPTLVDGVADRDPAVTVALGAVALHVVLTLAHGLTHAAIPVPVTDLQGAYSVVVLFGAPILGGALLWRGRLRVGAAFLLAAGLAALGFEALSHFVVDSPDNVAAVDSGALAFGVSATLSTASDAALAVAGGWLLARHRQGSAATSCIESAT